MDTEKYLIIGHDLYYRADCQGYTGIKDEAGRYEWDEIKGWFPDMKCPNDHGLSFIKESEAPEYSKACYHDLREIVKNGRSGIGFTVCRAAQIAEKSVRYSFQELQTRWQINGEGC